MTSIKVKDLSKSFTQYKKAPGVMGSIKSIFNRQSFEVPAVKDVSFEIQEGEVVGFIGPNGAGKTTTLKMLSGILHPTSGDISVLGFNPTERKKEFQKQFSIVMGQKSQLWWDLPAIEGFNLNKEIYEVNTKETDDFIQYLAGILEVKDILKVPVRKLSLGQRMKCELIASLLHRPKILFLDEPTIGLDIVVQKRIREFFKEYNSDKKTTIILTSHYMDDVSELCERIIVINKGTKVYDGRLDELVLKHAPFKVLKIVFNEQVKKAELQKFGKINEFDKKGYFAEISVDRKDHTKIAGSILNTYKVDDLDISEIGLEEIISNIFNQ